MSKPQPQSAPEAAHTRIDERYPRSAAILNMNMYLPEEHRIDEFVWIAEAILNAKRALKDFANAALVDKLCEEIDQSVESDEK
jgi:hypothetical protein